MSLSKRRRLQTIDYLEDSYRDALKDVQYKDKDHPDWPFIKADVRRLQDSIKEFESMKDLSKQEKTLLSYRKGQIEYLVHEMMRKERGER